MILVRHARLLGLLSVLPLVPVSALTLTQSQSFSFSGSGSGGSGSSASDTDTFAFQLFSASLGTLTGVELTATGSGDVTHRQNYTSISSFTHNVGLTTSFGAGPLTATSSGTATSGVVPIINPGQPIFFTGNIPFTATASTTLPASLAQFIGPGSSTGPISLTATGNSQLSGETSFTAAANVTLTYTYTPVAPVNTPDAGSTLLLTGLALGGMLVVRRRLG